MMVLLVKALHAFGFHDTTEEDTQDTGPDFLPSADELGVRRDRPLLVYTWGQPLFAWQTVRFGVGVDGEHDILEGQNKESKKVEKTMSIIRSHPGTLTTD